MEIIYVIKDETGLGFLHLIMIALGCIAYILNKYLERYNRLLAEGKPTPGFGVFLRSPEVLVSGLLTLILSVMAAVGMTYQMPESPLATAIFSGITAFSGYGFIRTRMSAIKYSKQSKMMMDEES